MHDIDFSSFFNLTTFEDIARGTHREKVHLLQSESVFWVLIFEMEKYFKNLNSLF